MKTTDEILELLRQFKSVAGEKYGIEQLALFGSAARGEQREDSDIDICVKLHKTTFRTYMAIKEELEHLFHIKVDLLTLHENIRYLFIRYRSHRVQYFAGTTDAYSRAGLINLP